MQRCIVHPARNNIIQNVLFYLLCLFKTCLYHILLCFKKGLLFRPKRCTPYRGIKYILHWRIPLDAVSFLVLDFHDDPCCWILVILPPVSHVCFTEQDINGNAQCYWTFFECYVCILLQIQKTNCFALYNVFVIQCGTKHFYTFFIYLIFAA